MNKEYSFGSFKYASFTGKKSADFDNTIIKGSCFEQKKPMTPVFPAGLKNVTFEGCNLNNCLIPPGAKLVNCCNHQWKIQNDGEQWVIDSTSGKPVEPMRKAEFEKLKLSTDPKDIPEAPREAPLLHETRRIQKKALADLQMDTGELMKILREQGKI